MNELEGQQEIFDHSTENTFGIGKDRESYSFGVNLGYKDFTLGGSYLHDNKGYVPNETNAWDLGLKYTMGAFSVGVQDWSWQSTKGSSLAYKTDAKMILIGTVLNF